MCLETKDFSYFYADKRNRSGIKERCKLCFIKETAQRQKENPERYNQYSYNWDKRNPEKRKEVSREANKKIRQNVNEMLRNFKLLNGCAHCGYKEHYAALEFDHIKPVKNDREFRRYPETYKSADELMKDSNVQVLCANCHGIKTHNNKEYIKKVS
jgi:5-methylcytosine-specific restriction endonuclease McrA